MKIKISILSFLLLFISIAGYGQLSLAEIFNEGMVLQRNAEVNIWGEALAGQELELMIQDKRYSTISDAAGQWKIKTEALQAGGPYALTVKSNSEEVKLQEVYVGEVWIAAGQSNMAWTLEKSDGAKEAIAKAKNKNIRFVMVPVLNFEGDKIRGDLSWKTATTEHVAPISGIAYFFAEQLQRALNVPVGIVCCYKGGTAAEVWMSRETLLSRPEHAPIVNAYEDYQNRLGKIQYELLYDDYVQKQRKYADSVKAGHQAIRPIEPMGEKNYKRPYGLYNTMLKRILPYSAKGVIWYQGEANAARSEQYHTLFPALIEAWRQDFEQPDLHFHFVQLSNYDHPAYGTRPTWAELREAQLFTWKKVANTAMVVSMDVGNKNDIHPTNKKPVGERLAATALNRVYGYDVPWSGPVYRSMHINESQIVLDFDYVYSGLTVDGELKGFTICGENREFVPAKAQIVGQQVMVSAEGITHPIAVRYGWSNWSEANLKNKVGFPATPFRTDDFKKVTEGVVTPSYPKTFTKSPTYQITKDIQYSKASKNCRLDFHKPEGVSGPTPLVIHMHGGGWNHGDKESQTSFKPFTDMGFAVANVEYRLTPEATAPAAVEDVRAALHYLLMNAKELNIDPTKVVLHGTSAGAHLALVAGYLQNDRRFDGKGKKFRNEINIMAVINRYGPSDLFSIRNVGSAARWLGKGKDNEAFVKSLSPLHMINSKTPPTYIVHGDMDQVVPKAVSSDPLVAKLKATGVPHQYTVIPGGGHGKFEPTYRNQVNAEIAVFVNRLLNNTHQEKPLEDSGTDLTVKTWNASSITHAKTVFPAATALLIAEADKELKRTIKTVVDKGMIPPSGNKHDYMSMGRYWWPNPDTESGLPYIRKDGLTNPEIEKLDRIPLAQMTQGVKYLALAYQITGEERYAAKAVDHLRRWFLNTKTRMNPHMNYGQTVPGHNNGLGRGFGIIDTYSFIEMLDGVELIKSSKNWKAKDEQGLIEWFSQYLDWMLESAVGKEEYEAANNHGLAFDVQIVRFAIFTGRLDIARRFLNDFPKLRLFSQIEPDGSQPLELARTTAFGYSVFNLGHILDMCMMSRSLGIDLMKIESHDGRSIRKALEFLLPWAGKEQSTFPWQQIKDWSGVQQNYALVLYRADLMNKEQRYKKYYENYVQKDKQNINLIIF